MGARDVDGVEVNAGDWVTLITDGGYRSPEFYPGARYRVEDISPVGNARFQGLVFLPHEIRRVPEKSLDDCSPEEWDAASTAAVAEFSKEEQLQECEPSFTSDEPEDDLLYVTEPKALEKQVAGSHYKNMAIQPIEFSMKNNLNACQHSAIKYICRYKDKGGLEDLAKAKHFIEMLEEDLKETA